MGEQQLLHLMRQLSTGDLSILENAIAHVKGGKGPTAATPSLASSFRSFGRRVAEPVRQPVLLGTAVGSSNHRLWLEFERLGWMAVREDEGLAADANMLAFELLDQGCDPITWLLRQHRAKAGEANSNMAAIVNDRCLPFAADLLQRVRESGGDGADVALLMGLTLAVVVRAANYDDRQSALKGIVNIAQERLASG